MRQGVLLIAAAAIGAALLLARKQGDGEAWYWGDNLGQDYINNLGGGVIDGLDSIAGSASELWDEFTGAILGISSMKKVTAADVAHPNVQAFLRVIRRGEGTAGENGYRTLFGGGLFTGYADHPRVKVSKSGYTSTAAGAYQFLSSTWDETARVMGLPDFTPASQDRGAVGRIMYRGALDDVKAGRFEQAIKKVAREWASMPGSPYGQPVISMATALSVYSTAGGAFA
jgi:muramidase (phage lysozyme)